MGRFTDTTFTNTIDSLVSSIKNNALQNPYLKFSDKKATKVTYYKQNIEKTTTDEGSADIYQTIGTASSIKYNKINDFLLYGIEQISISNQIGEFGFEAEEVSGSAIILPKTIIPTSGDYFRISYVKEDLLFLVNDANSDSLDYGNNIYKIEYTLAKRDVIEEIEKQVVEEYNFIFDNVGTDFQAIITSTSYDTIKELDVYVESMRSLYSIFFDNSVQNYVYNYSGYRMYDPYMIEFMIRHNIMGNENYISHGTPLQSTFGYDYSKSFFAIIESGDVRGKEFNCEATAKAITEVNTLFVTRLYEYYKVEYSKRGNQYGLSRSFNIFDADLLMKLQDIDNAEYYCDGTSESVYNLLIAYFKDDTDYISENTLKCIEKLDYTESKEYFYLIPIYMYIINRYSESLMTNKTIN